MAMTVGVPLDGDHTRAVRAVQARVGRGKAYGAPGGRPRPHISLVVLLQPPDAATVDAVLRDVAATAAPIRTRARGFGVFASPRGDEVVLHVPVVRTVELSELHARLCTAFTALDADVEGYHRPETWFPHITLVRQPLTPSEAGAMVTVLAEGPPVSWHLCLDRLARFDPNDGETGALDHVLGAAPVRR